MAEPTKPFTVERTKRTAAASSPAIEASSVAERVVESTRHLQDAVPDADLRVIRETLKDKLHADPMFVGLLQQAAGT